jgi:hypothetical protein
MKKTCFIAAVTAFTTVLTTLLPSMQFSVSAQVLSAGDTETVSQLTDCDVDDSLLPACIEDEPTIEIPNFGNSEVILASDDSENESSAFTTIEISSKDDLIAMRDAVNNDPAYSVGKEFSLTTDIDLGGMEWEPIGYTEFTSESTVSDFSDTAFRGIFNGNGHTVSNFKITDSTVSTPALFSIVYGGVIYDLNVKDAVVDIEYSASEADEDFYPNAAAILCAYSLNSAIIDCNVEGDISITSDIETDSMISCGIAVGQTAGYISFTPDVSSVTPENKQLENVTVSGLISLETPVVCDVGGVAGSILITKSTSELSGDEKYTIHDLKSDASLTVSSDTTAYTGGIIGRSDNPYIDIEKCEYSPAEDGTASISDSSKFTIIGGIAGRIPSSMIDCTVGNVSIETTPESYTYFGGIIGLNFENEIKNCSSSAALKINPVETSIYIYVGGITGITHRVDSSKYESYDDSAKITSCSFDGSISTGLGTSTTASIGFITGYLYTPGIIDNCTVTNSAELNFLNNGGYGVYVGGIAGKSEGGIIRRCANYKDITIDGLTPSSYLRVGGITGSGSVGQFDVYNEGTSSSDTDREYTSYIISSLIQDCINEGNLTISTGAPLYLGGIVGYLTGQKICYNGQPRAERCYTTGDITANISAKKTQLIGGAFGYIIDSEVTDCYSTGDVSLTFSDDAKDSTAFVSGFARVKQNAYNITKANSIVWNCYATGNVSVPENATNTKVGKFASDLSSNYNSKTNSNPDNVLYPFVHDNYYLTDDENADASIAEPLTAEQFADKNSFRIASDSDDDALWDFDSVWYMDDGRPHLLLEKTAVYSLEYASENNQNTAIDSITISKPQKGTTLYIASYSGSVMTDISSVNLDDYIENDNFAVVDVPFEIPPLASQVRLFLWDDNMVPSCDAATAKLTAES